MLTTSSCSSTSRDVTSRWSSCWRFFFFFNDTATTEIYTLSLHDALPISWRMGSVAATPLVSVMEPPSRSQRSEEHTSELQSLTNLVCRLLLEKKKEKQLGPTVGTM